MLVIFKRYRDETRVVLATKGLSQQLNWTYHICLLSFQQNGQSEKVITLKLCYWFFLKSDSRYKNLLWKPVPCLLFVLVSVMLIRNKHTISCASKPRCSCCAIQQKWQNSRQKCCADLHGITSIFSRWRDRHWIVRLSISLVTRYRLLCAQQIEQNRINESVKEG